MSATNRYLVGNSYLVPADQWLVSSPAIMVVLASDYDTLCDEWRVATGAVIMQRQELAELRDELVQRDARIAELEATKLHGEMVRLRTDRDRLAAELRYTIAAYVTGNKPSGVVDERVEFDVAWPSIAAELPSHQRSQYSAGDVYAAEREAALEGWRRARLNTCRAQSVADDAYDWSVFPGYLIDHCEGYEVAEESLRGWLSEMFTDPHYGALFRREKTADGQPVNHSLPITTAIEAAEEEHGGLRAAAKALGIDPGYLSRLKSAEKINPSGEVLSALGLERVTIYRAAPSAKKESGQ